MRKHLIVLLGLSAVLILAGISLLFGQPSAVLPIPGAQPEASVAYEPELITAYDATASSTDVLTAVGGLLVLGGLMISAVAFGRRLGQETPNAE